MPDRTDCKTDEKKQQSWGEFSLTYWKEYFLVRDLVTWHSDLSTYKTTVNLTIRWTKLKDQFGGKTQCHSWLLELYKTPILPDTCHWGLGLDLNSMWQKENRCFVWGQCCVLELAEPKWSSMLLYLMQMRNVMSCHFETGEELYIFLKLPRANICSCSLSSYHCYHHSLNQPFSFVIFISSYSW